MNLNGTHLTAEELDVTDNIKSDKSKMAKINCQEFKTYKLVITSVVRSGLNLKQWPSLKETKLNLMKQGYNLPSL